MKRKPLIYEAESLPHPTCLEFSLPACNKVYLQELQYPIPFGQAEPPNPR